MSDKTEKGEFKKGKPSIVPAFSVYHPNHKGNGTAAAFRINPATIKASGFVQLEMAQQLTVGDSDRRVYPTFNWKSRIITRLTPVETAEIVMCLRGVTESIRDGNGFQHRSDGGSSRITLTHMVQPKSCYQLKVSHETIAGTDRETAIYFTPAETYALAEGLAGSMARLCFGH